MMKKSTNYSLSILSMVAIIFLFSSCQREIGFDSVYAPATLKNLTVEGVVTDAAGAPLKDVTIRAGSVQVTTDLNGSFRASNVTMSTTEAFVTATKAGYFTGSRTFFTREGSNNFVRIQLLKRDEAGAANAAGGGIVRFGNAAISFPANAFITSSNAAYTGNVSVKAAYINPTSNSMNQQMPGDLRGRNLAGQLRGLRSFGMMAIELEGSGGQKLQLKSGVQATLTFPIPATLISKAPNTIPLWYFDETTGLWKEEGSATKIANNYVGTVTHFSFWNVDDPYEYVHISMKVVNTSNQAIEGAEVALTSLTDSTTTFDYTDENGYIDGYVPKNTQLRRDIFDECNTPLSSTVIGPFSTDATLGNVQVTATAATQTITGSVTDCNNQPVTNGHVVIGIPGRTIYASVTNGQFTSTFSSCTGVSSATIIAINDSTQQQSSVVTVNLNAPSVSAGTIPTCVAASQTFFTLTVDGVTRTWNTAPYDFYAYEDTLPAGGGFYDIYVGAFDTINQTGPMVTLFRPVGTFTAPGTVGLSAIEVYDPLAAPNMRGDYFSLSFTQQPTLTQYGSIGQFVTGSFAGEFMRNDQQISDTVTVSCSFKVIRTP